MKYIILVLILLSAGCSSVSQAPSVSAVDKNGDFYTLINKQTYFMYYLISARNVIVKCNEKTLECKTLIFKDVNGNRIW